MISMVEEHIWTDNFSGVFGSYVNVRGIILSNITKLDSSYSNFLLPKTSSATKFVFKLN